MLRLSRVRRALLDGAVVGAEPLSRLSAFALARTALRAARERRDSVGFWRAVSARAIDVAPSMQPADMSTILFAFATMRLRDREMMQRLAEASPPILGQFKADDITYFLAAFARLDVQSKLALNLMAREIARKLDDFSAAQLGELVYAYARLGVRHDLLMDVLKKRILEVVKALKPWHMAMVANGYARLQVADERFFTILAQEICRKIPDFNGKALAMVANAYARLSVRNQFLLEVLGDEAFRRRGELDAHASSLLLNSYARLRFSHPVLFDYVAQEAPRRIKTYSMQSMCLLASAFATHRRADEALFEKIGDHTCNNALSLYPRAVATILLSFADVDIRHGTLFFNAPQHVAKHVKEYTTDELAMVAKAYGTFQMVHLQLFDVITKALPVRQLSLPERDRPELFLDAGDDDAELELGPKKSAGPGKTFAAAAAVPTFDIREEAPEAGPEEQVPRVVSLLWLLEAYGRLTIFEAHILELLCDSICSRREELTPPLIVQAVRAAAALSFSHPGIVQLGISVVEQEGENMTFEELEIITRALEALGVVGDSKDTAAALAERPAAAYGSDDGTSLT